jgi:hypothetical protein
MIRLTVQQQEKIKKLMMICGLMFFVLVAALFGFIISCRIKAGNRKKLECSE